MVECTASRLVGRVVNRWGEPGLMRKREMFSLLAHFSWRVKVGPRELESALLPEKPHGTSTRVGGDVRVSGESLDSA